MPSLEVEVKIKRSLLPSFLRFFYCLFSLVGVVFLITLVMTLTVVRPSPLHFCFPKNSKANRCVVSVQTMLKPTFEISDRHTDKVHT